MAFTGPARSQDPGCFHDWRWDLRPTNKFVFEYFCEKRLDIGNYIAPADCLLSGDTLIVAGTHFESNGLIRYNYYLKRRERLVLLETSVTKPGRIDLKQRQRNGHPFKEEFVLPGRNLRINFAR